MATAPNANNYRISGARIYVLKSGELGYLDLGNIVSPVVQPTITSISHYTARSGVRREDRREVTQQDLKMNFQLDEFNSENLAICFRGGAITTFSQVGATITNEAVTLVQNRAVRLAKRKITKGSVVIDGLVEGVDYTVDYEIGAITVLSAPYGTEDVVVDYVAETISAGKKFNPLIHSGIQKLDGGILVTVSTDGDIDEHVFGKGTIECSGDVKIDDTNWDTMSFSLSVLDDGSGTSPFGTYMQYVD